MAFWLAAERTVQAESVVTRFDPRFWTVNFPRPMMASVVSTTADALRVDAVFYRQDDLAGLIWESEDVRDHPLLRYETARDYRRCRLRFRWRSAGVLALDAVNGPTLTIEGRDAGGAARTWYVRLWNYAVGTPEDAVVSIDFASVIGGFELPGEADPVWAGDIDRMFVSICPIGFTKEPADLAARQEGWVTLSDMACDGSGAVLAIGDAVLPEHSVQIAGGYDDSYNITPARLLRNALLLGYRGAINHYVGMSHYFRLEANSGGYYISLAGGVLNVACAAWHADFAVRAKALGYEVIWSLSYELLDQHCWNDWKQRAWDGSPALTGWEPPSTLLSPASDAAMGYLRQVAQAFIGLAMAAGLTPRFQVGEPWWWVMSDGRPCLYDAAARVALGGAPIEIPTVRGPLDADGRALLDAAGAVLAASTAALIAAVRAVAPAVETHVLAYLPSVLDPAAPDICRANLPTGWAKPAFDRLQLEDYDWVTTGNAAATARGIATAAARLGYADGEQDYFAGFVLAPERATIEWPLIEAGVTAAQRRGVGRAFIWALPQVLRDGFVHFEGDEVVEAFDDVLFPIALGKQAEVRPGFSTAIVTSGGGREQRNASWSSARTQYDVGPGIRSESDIAALLSFFRARMGPARGFRLRDPFDADSGARTPVDQQLGVGDGIATRFALIKHYGDQTRRITRPVAGTVRVAVDGVETAGFTVAEGGWVVFDSAPAADAVVTAGFAFDVPVRFAEDVLSVSRATFLAGSAVSVPLIELRED